MNVALAGRTLIFALVLWSTGLSQSDAQETPPAIEPLASDPDRGVDRYRVTLQPGGTLWNLSQERLPLIALEHGDQAALDIVSRGFTTTFPDRAITNVHPGDSFVLEVPAGTFVSRASRQTAEAIHYESFNGDRLVQPLRQPNIVYRLIRADRPDHAEVLVAGAEADPVELAKAVYEVDPPDFLQVRWMRDLGARETVRVTVNLQHRYLDEFRNYRSRATEVQDGESGLKVYRFNEFQEDIPFIRVEDAIGDTFDAAAFQGLFRVEYRRDGTVKKYLVTQPGDLVAVLRKPENAKWARIYDDWTEWEEGIPNAVEPFAPPLNNAGSLISGRILVLTFQPKARTSAGTGIECMGIPVIILAGGLAFGLLQSRRTSASHLQSSGRAVPDGLLETQPPDNAHGLQDNGRRHL